MTTAARTRRSGPAIPPAIPPTLLKAIMALPPERTAALISEWASVLRSNAATDARIRAQITARGAAGFIAIHYAEPHGLTDNPLDALPRGARL